MTAIPGHDRATLTLSCDACGQTVSNIECPLKHWTVVWDVVRPTGWSGSPLPTGPHRCPRCSSR